MATLGEQTLTYHGKEQIKQKRFEMLQDYVKGDCTFGALSAASQR
jgi:uncharacterized protein YutD